MLREIKSKTQPQENFLDRLAQRLSGTAIAATIFATPIERGNVTVIPVAKAMYGFGGGAGVNDGEQGSGGGGGVRVLPVGYIEIRNGSTHYRPIRNPLALIPAAAVTGILSYLAVRGLTKLLSSSQTGDNKQ